MPPPRPFGVSWLFDARQAEFALSPTRWRALPVAPARGNPAGAGVPPRNRGSRCDLVISKRQQSAFEDPILKFAAADETVLIVQSPFLSRVEPV